MYVIFCFLVYCGMKFMSTYSQNQDFNFFSDLTDIVTQSDLIRQTGKRKFWNSFIFYNKTYIANLHLYMR